MRNNLMLWKLVTPALMAASISMPAMADDEYFDYARVLAVTPQTERVNMPHEECRTDYVRERYTTADRSPVGAIIGGIAGGLLGSQIGKGNGRVAGAAVGAGVGAVVGDRVGSTQRTGYSTRPVEHCAVVDDWQTVNRGYLVTYRYNGREYSTVTDTYPGESIRVRVAVAPGHGAERISYHDSDDRYEDDQRWERGHGRRYGHRYY
ncbi:MAG TPA: glycine zipper 2TM domain-containing protein [Methylophilaceae bacterium]|nr:glycine zipper 2TM domain-containing protein [Methylophilaceae bacterium]